MNTSKPIKYYRYFLIIDLEATCCDLNTFPRHQMETIEIGAVMVNASTLEVEDEFQTFVRPVRNPMLTDFCTELTTIEQQDVDRAPLFPEAMKALGEWLKPYYDYVFCSWGDYDDRQLRQDCVYHQCSTTIAAPHINIKKEFSRAQNRPRRYGMAKALQLAGLPLDGTHHRGIDDARNMAKLMPWILGQKQLSTSP